MNTRPTIPFDHHTPEFVDDPFGKYAELREQCPVAWSESHGGFWLLSRYEDVRSALLDWETFSSGTPGTVAIPNTTGARDFRLLPIEVDPPIHGEFRSIAAPYFKRAALASLAPAVQAAADSIVDRLPVDEPIDLMEDYALPLTSHALAALLRLPSRDADFWVDCATKIFAGRVADPAGAKRATEDLLDYCREILIERRTSPDGHLLSEIANAWVGGQPIQEIDALGFMVELLLAGREATVDGISSALWYFGTHDEDRTRLTTDPELIPGAVEELLRWMSPVQLLGRRATRDVSIHEYEISKGEAIAVMYGAANRDAGVFPEPDKCDIMRSPNRHLAFGAGPHVCLGAHLARLDMAVALATAVRRFPSYELLDPTHPDWAPNGDARGLRSLPARLVPLGSRRGRTDMS